MITNLSFLLNQAREKEKQAERLRRQGKLDEAAIVFSEARDTYLDALTYAPEDNLRRRNGVLNSAGRCLDKWYQVTELIICEG